MKKIAMFFLTSAIGAFIGATTICLNTKKCEGNKLRKFRMYYNLLDQWIFLKNRGINLETYFTINKINSIAIYGMGEVGERLYEELEKSRVQVKYAIDRNRFNKVSELPIFDLTHELEHVDLIVATPIFDYKSIEKEIKENVDYKVISLYDVIFGII